MTEKNWKKTVSLKIKQEWEHRKTGEYIFITPSNFDTPKGEWDVYWEGKNKNNLDVLRRARRKNKASALAYAKRYMKRHDKRLKKVV